MLSVSELRELAGKATQGEWHSGRRDMVSYHAGGDGPFKNVYVDDPNGKWHMGERLPAVVCECFDAVGADCRDNADYVAAACNSLPSILDRLEAAEAENERLKHEKEDMRQRNQFLRTRPDLNVEDLRRRMQRFGVLDRLDAADRLQDGLRELEAEFHIGGDEYAAARLATVVQEALSPTPKG
jgi:hypothetical protein